MTRRHLPHSILALLGAAFLVAGCGGGSDSGSVSVDMPDTEMSAADAAKVDAAVTAVWNPVKDNLPALYVGVWDPEKGVFEKAYGDASKGVPATLDDSLRIGSISKTFTANVILQLVDDGKLSLDDTISDAAPEVAKKYPQVADRTIRQLLDMHSGISDY
jgi:D-alanyl-D-alanine carboxypeptidase